MARGLAQSEKKEGKELQFSQVVLALGVRMELRLSPGSLETHSFWSSNRLAFSNRSVSQSTVNRSAHWRRVILTIAFLHRLKTAIIHKRNEAKQPWTVVSAVVRFKAQIDQQIQPQLPASRAHFNAKSRRFRSVQSQVSTVDSMGSFYGSAWSLRNLVSGSALGSPSNASRRTERIAATRPSGSFTSVSPTFERSNRGKTTSGVGVSVAQIVCAV